MLIRHVLATAADAYTLGPGRVTSIVAGLSALIGVGTGVLALVRRTGTNISGGGGRGGTTISGSDGNIGGGAGTNIGGGAGTTIGGGAGLAGRRRRAIVAVALGLVGLAGGVVVVVTADGGLGTGNGLGGGVVAAVLGLAAVVLGGWTARTSRGT
jgi:Family of unknown function (DUF6223)